MGQQRDDASGCGMLVAALLVIGAVVAAVVSVAALIDPFSWVPPIDEVWADCESGSAAAASGCDLGDRYPGFWGHVIVNLLYVVGTVFVLGGLAAAVGDLREARQRRFSEAAAIGKYREAQQTVSAVATLGGILALIPIVVALA